MTLAEGKTIVEIVALLLAGAWAIYGFFILRQREKASAELRKLELEARKAEMELRRVGVIRTEITAASTLSSLAGGYDLLAEVVLFNEGKRDTRLNWKGESPAFTVRSVAFDSSGAPTFPDNPIEVTVRQTRNPNIESTSHVVRAGGSQRLAFAAHLSHSGVYLLSFRGVVAPEEVQVAVEAGTKPSSTLSWTAAKYVIVPNVEPIVKTTNHS